jgi:hypothetical protein
MAPCSLNPNRQEGEKGLLRSENRTVAMVKKGAEDDLEMGKRSRPKTREKKREWCEYERRLSESRYSGDRSWTGWLKVIRRVGS